jgi:capsular exopolysaccharide synthesis family protein
MELISPPEGTQLAESVGASTAAILKQTMALVRRRRGLFIAGLFVVYTLGGIYYASRDFVYEARASILVHPLGDALSGRSDEGQNFMPTHIRLVTTTAVLDRAIEKMKLKDQELEESHDWPGVDPLAESLKVTSQKDTEILEIAYRTKNKSSAVPILEAVVGAYLDFVNETHRSTSRDILQILTQQKDELDKQLREKESALLALQEKEGILTTEDEKNNVAMMRVRSVNDSLTQARVRRLELEARAQALKLAIERKEPVDAFLIRYLDRMGPDLIAGSLGLHQNTQNFLFQQDIVRRSIVADQLDLQRLTNIYGPKHPKVQMLEEKIRLTSQSLTPEKMTPELKSLNQKELQDLAMLLIESDIKEAKNLEEDLRRQCEVEKAVALEANARHAPFVALEMDLSRLRNFYDTVNLRIRQVNLGGDAGAVTTQVIEPPLEPQSPVSPDLRKVTLACTILGVLFGLALCYLFEWWDTGYRGPEDIVQHLNLQVVGHVPRMTASKEGMALELIMDHTPRSIEAEAFRTMRTAMMLCDSPPRKFTITSPEPGDGKTLILTNLAIAFAKSGLRVLLVDCDLRRPRLRELFELPRSPGLSKLLQDPDFKEEDLQKSIEQTKVSNMDILPSGSNPPNPTELLTGTRFGQILDWADSRYDRILCDAPPILAVSDCALIGRRLDGAFLVIRADKNDRVMARRARDTLHAMNCNVLGAIVNSLFTGDTYGYAYYRKSSYYSKYHDYHSKEVATDAPEPSQGSSTPGNGSDDMPPPHEGPDPEKKVA